MRLQDEVRLRNVIRQVINETRARVNRGWEGYEHGLDADNSDIDAGYHAHYYQQYANSTMGLDNIAELDSGGMNVLLRRKKRRRRKKK